MLDNYTTPQNYVPIQDGRLYSRPDDTQDAEKNRFLTFVGNEITPSAIRDRGHLKAGGIEVANHCLRFVNYFLRQCRITPLLEDQIDPVAPETVDPNDKSFYKIVPPKGYVAPGVLQGQIGTIPPPLVSKRLLPGDQVEIILSGENLRYTTPRGIVELKDLKGYDYKPEDLGNGLWLDKEIWRIQKAIFPNYPVLPVLISDIRQILDDAWDTHVSLRGIIEHFQLSSQQFEDYARASVEQAHMNMNDVAAAHGYAMRYTEKDLVLLAQLGMKRRDREYQQMARMTGENQQVIVQQGGQTANELLELLAHATQEERTTVLDMLKRKNAAIKATGGKPDPVQEAFRAEAEAEAAEELEDVTLPNPVLTPEQVQAETPAETPEISEQTMMAQPGRYECSVCPRSFGSKGALGSHLRTHETKD